MLNDKNLNILWVVSRSSNSYHTLLNFLVLYHLVCRAVNSLHIVLSIIVPIQ